MNKHHVIIILKFYVVINIIFILLLLVFITSFLVLECNQKIARLSTPFCLWIRRLFKNIVESYCLIFKLFGNYWICYKNFHWRLRGSVFKVSRREMLGSNPCRTRQPNHSEFYVVFFGSYVNTGYVPSKRLPWRVPLPLLGYVSGKNKQPWKIPTN